MLYLCKLILYDHMPYMYWMFIVYFLYNMSIVYVTCILYISALVEPS